MNNIYDKRRGDPSRRAEDFEPQPISGLPWWAKLAQQWGAPTVGVAFFIWWMTQVQLPMMKETKDILNDRVLPIVTKMQADQAYSKEQMSELINIGRASCVIAAKTQDEKRSCLR